MKDKKEMMQAEPKWVDVRQLEDITFVHDWEKEIGKGLKHPWIRLCARLFDGMFYWVLILAYHWIAKDVYFPVVGFGSNLTFWQIVECRYLILAVMMVLEPQQMQAHHPVLKWFWLLVTTSRLRRKVKTKRRPSPPRTPPIP